MGEVVRVVGGMEGRRKGVWTLSAVRCREGARRDVWVGRVEGRSGKREVGREKKREVKNIKKQEESRRRTCAFKYSRAFTATGQKTRCRTIQRNVRLGKAWFERSKSFSEDTAFFSPSRMMCTFGQTMTTKDRKNQIQSTQRPLASDW